MFLRQNVGPVQSYIIFPAAGRHYVCPILHSHSSILPRHSDTINTSSTLILPISSVLSPDISGIFLTPMHQKGITRINFFQHSTPCSVHITLPVFTPVNTDSVDGPWQSTDRWSLFFATTTTDRYQTATQWLFRHISACGSDITLPRSEILPAITEAPLYFLCYMVGQKKGPQTHDHNSVNS